MARLFKVLITLTLIFTTTAVAAKKVALCGNCDKVAEFLKSNEEDEKKAYESFNDFLATVQISKDKKIAAQEIHSILQAVPVFLENDERRELPDYLVAIQDSNPREFATALKDLTPEQQESLKEKMQVARKMLKDGEEP